jgi:hypothetical protein
MDKDRLNFILCAILYRSKKQDLLEEMAADAKKQGFDPDTDMLNYILSYKDSSSAKPSASLTVVEKEGKDEPTLREELTAIRNSPWNFQGMYDREGCIEICSEEGGILDKKFSELTAMQKSFIRTMRGRNRHFLAVSSNAR